MNEKQIHDAAAQAFAAAAAEAKQPGGKIRSVWRRRIEPWLIAIAALLFVAWAIARVFLSR